MSDKNWKHITEKMIEHGGELVLDFTEIVRLIGIEYGEDDYYWKLRDYKGKEYLSSCVARIVPLKNCLEKEFYNYLDTFYFPENEKINRKVFNSKKLSGN